MQINAISLSTEHALPARDKAEKSETVKPAVREVSKPPAEEKAGVDKLKTALAEHNVSLKYRRDDQTKALIVELVDEKTGEAIRQIPSEVSLKLTAQFSKLQGLLLDERQ